MAGKGEMEGKNVRVGDAGIPHAWTRQNLARDQTRARAILACFLGLGKFNGVRDDPHTALRKPDVRVQPGSYRRQQDQDANM